MNQTVSFAKDIRPLFTKVDIDHMSGFLICRTMTT